MTKANAPCFASQTSAFTIDSGRKYLCSQRHCTVRRPRLEPNPYKPMSPTQIPRKVLSSPIRGARLPLADKVAASSVAPSSYMKVARKMETASADCVPGSKWAESMLLTSFRHFRFQMLQGGRGNAKFVRQFQSDAGTQQFENGIVMNGMSDAEHDLASNVRANRLVFARSIRHAVRHSTLALKRIAGQFSEIVNQAFGCETSAGDGVLQLRVSAPLIVVDLSRAKAF